MSSSAMPAADTSVLDEIARGLPANGASSAREGSREHLVGPSGTQSVGGGIKRGSRRADVVDDDDARRRAGAGEQAYTRLHVLDAAASSEHALILASRSREQLDRL